MADYTGIFERVEQKYLLDSLQFEALWAVLEPYMPGRYIFPPWRRQASL